MKALSSGPSLGVRLLGGVSAGGVLAGGASRGGAARVERAPSGSVGRKAVAALSGVLLAGWSVLHLIGISSAYAGAAVMERYAGWLRQGAGVPLWGMRLVLGAVFALHLWLVLGLWARARRARPIGYAGASPSRGMAGGLRWASLLLLAGIVGHVLHFSFGAGLPGFDHRHVYSNLLGAFRAWGVTLLYLGFAALFGFHLAHGLFAAPVSVGAAWRERRRRVLGWTLAIGVAAAFAALPLAVQLGVLR
ncbi:MAG TPA: hypothetical protein VMG12_31605 [Polyangiaceae bacterium]|nr:hypothetical protein [Polyangiaceae bacterium]